MNKYYLSSSYSSLIMLIVLMLNLQEGLTIQAYKKILHKVDQQAKCLDGSPAAIYEHIGSQSNKFMLFFGGGGDCGSLTFSQTIQSCYQRSKTDLGSSSLMFDQLRPQGMLSTDPSKSKFANWSKFIFAYCDGGFHQGLRTQPINYKDSKLYARGATITRAHLKYIEDKYNLKSASQVIVSGVSAGAIAAFQWTNHIQTLVINPSVVSTIIDSGIFLNATSVDTHQYKSTMMLQNQYKFSNPQQKTPFQQCNQISLNSQWNCMFLSHAYKLVKGRVLILESLYDSYDLFYQYDIKCLVYGTQGNTFKNCSKQEQTGIDNRFLDTVKLMNDMRKVQSFSLWGLSCANHVYLGSWKFYSSENQTTIDSKIGAKDAVEKFILNKQKIDYVDKVKWPGNNACAY